MIKSLKTVARFSKRLRPRFKSYLFISLLGILLAGIDMIPPRLVGNAVNLMSHGAFSMTSVLWIVLLWAVVALCNQALHGYQIDFATRTGEKVLAQLRADLFAHLQKVSIRFFEQNRVARLFAAFGSDLDPVRGLATWGLNTITSNAAFMIFSAVMIYKTDSRMFLAVVWIAPLMTLLNFVYGRRLGRSWQKIRRDSVRVDANQAENISGYRVVTAFNRQLENLVQFNELQDINTLNHSQASRENGVFQPMLQWVRFLGQALVLSYGGYRAVRGEMQAGDLVAISLYWEWFMMPAVNFGNFFNELVVAASGLERVSAIFDVQAYDVDAPDAYALPKIEGEIEFSDVGFSYLENRPVLSDLSFKVKKGQTVALVGATGSGKTTLLGLLANLHRSQAGEIFVDGNPLSKVKRDSYQKQIALVLQNKFLFSGTVLENLKFDRPELSDHEVFVATQALGCHERFLKLKDGYQTQVGESGTALSLGERQLICFARALIRDPKLLLLDEATSAMDPETDVAIRSALRRLARERTTFIVTHRLSTAIDADVILVLERGRIVEQGSHDTLLKLNGAYAKFYRDAQSKPNERRELERSTRVEDLSQVLAH